MAQQTRAVLETYFETGDMPTEAEFAELIESCLNLASDGYLTGSDDAVVPVAGGTQGTGYAITALFNSVSSSSSDTDACVLMTAKAGRICIVENLQQYWTQMFPAVGDGFNQLAANASIDIPPYATMVFYGVGDDNWLTQTRYELNTPQVMSTKMALARFTY